MRPPRDPRGHIDTAPRATPGPRERLPAVQPVSREGLAKYRQKRATEHALTECSQARQLLSPTKDTRAPIERRRHTERVHVQFSSNRVSGNLDDP
jgi:hypothetical protein